MSESTPSKVFLFDDDDPEMQGAYEKARATFGHFWREIFWERRRIIPGLELAAVKAPFRDPPGSPRNPDKPNVEHMWFNDVDFDGKVITGVLLNAPNWLTTVTQGDPVSVPLAEISDWMYAIAGQVYGAHTVNILRSRMGRQERRDHDSAWGLDFGDPNVVRLVPEPPKKSGGLLGVFFGKPKGPTIIGEHPASVSMAPKLKEQLADNPSLAQDKDDAGWTYLHKESLAGNLTTMSLFLEFGADVNAVTNHGMTPMQLARSLGWAKAVALLVSKGAHETQ